MHDLGQANLDSSRGSSGQSQSARGSNSPLSGMNTGSSRNTMLSVDFSTPLAGLARSARIKQMSNNHPAFEKSRLSQEILVKVQHSLRRMPGVSAAESNEIVAQLQEVGQIISQETSQLVDALMNSTLDHLDTDRSIARMAIEANLAKAANEDQAQEIKDLREEVAREKTKREAAEGEMKKMLADLEGLTQDLKRLKGDADDAAGDKDARNDQQHVAKGLEDIIQNMEEQVNKHRTLWVMRRSNPEAVARAIESANESAQNTKKKKQQQQQQQQQQQPLAKAMMPPPAPGPSSQQRPLLPPAKAAEKTAGNTGPSRGSLSADAHPPPRAQSVFQPIHRPTTAGPPPKFGQLQSAPPRAPSTMPHDRRGNSIGWASERSSGLNSRSGSFSSVHAAGPSGFAQSAFRAPSRKGFHHNNNNNNNNNSSSSISSNNSHHHHHHHQHQHHSSSGSRFRNDFHTSAFAAHDHHPQPHHHQQQHPPPQRPSSSFGFGNRDALYPNTPTASGRARYGRSPAPVSVPVPSSSSMMDLGAASRAAHTHHHASHGSGALVARYGGPPILVTERTVAGWHDQIMDFYGIIRTFVERHANEPDTVRGIKAGAPGLWPILLATYHPLSEAEATSYLEFHLRNENSKSCLVTRVIIDFIVNRVWVPGAWSGADAESTYALVELEADFERTLGQPSVFRQPLLDQQAYVLESIIKSPSHGIFLKHKIEETTASLLHNLQPLLNKPAATATATSYSSALPPSTTPPSAAAATTTTTTSTAVITPPPSGSAAAPSPDAFRDMQAVVEHAWDLSGRLLTSRLTFDFRFPEIGSRFSSQSMLPIWPPMDPLELQAKHWRVALVTTPVVTCRNDTGSNISAHSVSLADVFCMQ